MYFFDNGLVRRDPGLRLENAVAAMLLKHVQFLAGQYLRQEQQVGRLQFTAAAAWLAGLAA